jgi:hypothetical protein
VIRSGWGASPQDVSFLKERGTAHRRVYAVNFDDREGHRRHALAVADRDHLTGGWTAYAGTASGYYGEHDPWRSNEPRINLASGWGDSGYCGAGTVHSAGFPIASVRLTFANGITLEDEDEAGVVLFATEERVEIPVIVEFLDLNGQVLARRVEMAGAAAWRREVHERLREVGGLE